MKLILISLERITYQYIFKPHSKLSFWVFEPYIDLIVQSAQPFLFLIFIWQSFIILIRIVGRST